mgnify:CR=1 FL=1
MDFSKLAACCVGVAVVVWGTDYRHHLNFGFRGEDETQIRA